MEPMLKPPLNRAQAPQAVIFDLDGVIFDSAECNVALYDHILVSLGHPPRARQSLHVIHTEPMDRSLQHLLGHGEDYRRAVAFWKQLDPTPFIHMLEPYPGVAAMLAALKGRARLAVATNRTTTARPVLEHFGLMGFFEQVVTPMEAGLPKPDPAMMALTLGLMGLASGDVVYVGDSAVDQGLCQAAGVRLVAFRNQALEAWAHISDFSVLPGLLGLAD